MRHLTGFNPILAAAIMVVAGCAAPESEPARVVDESQLNLNLPEPVAAESPCDCDAEKVVEISDFDRGIRALVARNYTEARVYFGRHRSSGSSGAIREADVGLAFVALLDESAEEKLPVTGAAVDERAEMMSLAIALVETLEGRVDALNAVNAMLEQDLAKREEALKRLRDLTLGQEEG